MSLDLLASLSRPNVIREDLPKHHLVIKKYPIQSKERVPERKINEYTKEEFLETILDTGIVGLGGDGFPTYIKYNTDKKIHTAGSCASNFLCTKCTYYHSS